MLSTKVEEDRRLSLDDLLFEIEKLAGKKYEREIVMKVEYQILQKINFDLLLYHPYHSLSAYFQDFTSLFPDLKNLNFEQINQKALLFIQKTFLTDVLFLYPPGIIAISSLFYCLDKELILDYLKQRTKDQFDFDLLERNIKDIKDQVEKTDIKEDTKEIEKKLRKIRKTVSEIIEKEEKETLEIEMKEQEIKREKKFLQLKKQEEEEQRKLLFD